MDLTARLSNTLADRYEIEGEIGAGGMATVYLARDLRHNRRVALKVLHPELSAVLGPERFLKEIELTANLQHPHILPLFDSGVADGLLFYVMPFVEGESLRGRLTREGQLPVADALRLTTEVAGALDYAHGKGLVHRDIKPENILLQHGQALLADFGIALAVQSAGAERMTQTGLSLGTPHYMAPEQVMGERGLDARADVYALGAVMYEMLAGEPPFTGPNSPAVLARVLTERPRSLRISRPQVPEHMQMAIEQALEKLPADRWQSAKAFADALNGSGTLATAHSSLTAAGRRPEAGLRGVPGWHEWTRSPFSRGVAIVALAALLSAVALGGLWRRTLAAVNAAPAVYFRLDLSPEEGAFLDAGGSTFAFSQDGGSYVYSAGPSGGHQLYLRRLNESVARVIPGTQSGLHPSFSPDARFLAFSIGEEIRRVSIDGGGPTRVAERVRAIAGLAWGRDVIILGSSLGGGLRVVPAAGGEPTVLTVPDTASGERDHRFPVVLPDGETVLFTSWGGSMDRARVGIASLRDGSFTVMDLGGLPVGMVDGLLVYHDAIGSLLGIPVDLSRGRTTGAPIPLVEDVRFGTGGAVKAALSHSGSLIYGTGLAFPERELTAVGLDGVTRPLSSISRRFAQVRYAPDGQRIAATIATETGALEIWTLDLVSGTLQPLTRGIPSQRPEWSPAGTEILYRRESAVWSQAADGTRPPEQLNDGYHGIITPDGKTLLYRAGGSGPGGNDLWMRSLTGDTVSRPLAVSSDFQHSNPAVSPDGQWVVYPSDESGSWQIYLQPFPGPGPKYAVSVDGGDHAVWADNGKLYYSSGTRMMEAVITTSPTFQVVSRRQLFEFQATTFDRIFYRNWDLAPDGSHFLITRAVESEVALGVFVIHNWAAELRARVEAN